MTNNIDEQIAGVWQVEQEILDVIHDLCVAHNLKYTLAYGTLIGAIRHGGFIPWDDDIDIIMPRKDYERLLAIWEKEAPSGYILQNTRINHDYINTFSKVRKDHTTFLQNASETDKSYHKGIFVDIFPADRVAAGKLANTVQYVACAINLLYTRGYASGSGGLIGVVERILLALPKKLHIKLRNAAEKQITKWSSKESLQWFVPSTIEYARHYYPANLFENMKQISFGNRMYCCVADPDAFLRADYGDYMQLPPEEERVWKHHPIIIDFEHNYEELPQK